MSKLLRDNELRQREMLDSSSHVSPSLPPSHLPLRSAALQSFYYADTENVRSWLHAVHAEQNAQDPAHDMAGLRQVMFTALAANDDIAMIEVLQTAGSEMPDAIWTLARVLGHLSEDGQVDAMGNTTALPPQARNNNGPSLEPGNTGASYSSVDQLVDPRNREFIVNGIDAPFIVTRQSVDRPVRLSHTWKNRRCFMCGMVFSRWQDQDRHERAHLPLCLHCPAPDCQWRGSRPYSFENHWQRNDHRRYHEKYGHTLERSQFQTFDPKVILEQVRSGVISFTEGQDKAILLVQVKARELGKLDMWTNKGGLNRRH